MRSNTKNPYFPQGSIGFGYAVKCFRVIIKIRN